MKIISGGQTGVDRAALDVALELGIPCGGWCPKGRKAEDGRIPDKYPLQESTSADYKQRTEWNVRDSDGTLILCEGEPTGGTALTVRYAAKYRKPCKVVDLSGQSNVDDVRTWIATHQIAVLNVAGPRESKMPMIHEHASRFLQSMLSAMRG